MQKRMAAVRACQKQPRVEEIEEAESVDTWYEGGLAPRAEVHWEGISDSEEEKEDELEYSDEECITEGEEDINPFSIMMARARQGNEAFHRQNAVFKYQRGSTYSKKTKKRKAAEALEREASVMDCRPLDRGFLTTTTASSPTESVARISREEMLRNIRRDAKQRLEKKLKSKTTKLLPQNMTRHQAVLAFFKLQESKQLGIEHFPFSPSNAC
jgi:hypothetical protein